MKVNSYDTKYIKPTTEILKLYNLDVDVDIYKYRGPSLSSENTIIEGFVKQDPFRQNHYMIFITTDFNVRFKRFIKHECAHIQQYVEGKLTSDINGNVYWEEEKIDPKVNILNRPHEIDAKKRVKELNKKLIKITIHKILNKLKFWQKKLIIIF